MTGKLAKRNFYLIKNIFFPGSAKYWEKRYSNNGNSGQGSYGENRNYKAAIINGFMADNQITSVLELGCGDGNQLAAFEMKTYVGLDVSVTAIRKCEQLFSSDASKKFYDYTKYFAANHVLPKYDLVLSLDVIYHLVEDSVFETYMQRLFESSSRFVIIYAWDVDGEKKYHVRHRKYSEWIKKNITGFMLHEIIQCKPGDNFCDFLFYKKVNQNR